MPIVSTAMSVIHNQFPPPFIFVSRLNLYHTYPKPYLFLPSRFPNLLSLSAALPTNISHSSNPIFLPFLEEEEEEEEEKEEEEDVEAREEEEHSVDLDDPIYKFLKSRTRASDPDPQLEGKLSLQKNRRTSWHLAPNTEPIEETETDLDADYFLVEEKEETVDQKELPEGTVGEIVRIARNLPENLTLGEALGDYEARLGETECVEVLELLGDERRLVDCLYFFEWMRLQEPSLVSPRACTVLFPMLGRGGMPDKLMVLFENLPSRKELRDFHVYNAAMSGLLCGGRYKMLDVF